MYHGVGLGSGVRTDYDMVHFRQPPRQCTHLAGESLYSYSESAIQIRYEDVWSRIMVSAVVYISLRFGWQCLLGFI